MDRGLLVRIAAGFPAPRARALLLELDHVVVLPVREIPELHGAGDIGRTHRVDVDVEVADHLRAARSVGPGLVGEHVVRVHRDDQVRPEDVVVDPAGFRLVTGIQERPAVSLAVHRHRLATVREHHPAALPRAAREEILAQVVRGELVEKRVDPRAVVALGVVLGHDLPVGRHVVGQPGGPAQA